MNMASPKVDLILEGRILGLIDLGRSYCQISREIGETTGRKVSKSKVGKVHKRKLSSPEGPTRKWRKMAREKIELKSMVSNDNPLPQRSIAAKLELLLKTVQHHMNKTLNMEKRKKKKVHRLNDEQKKKRRERTPKLL